MLSRLFQKLRSGRQSPTLTELLARASRSPEGRQEFYKALLVETIFFPGEREDGAIYIRPYDVDGRVTIFFFSSPELLVARLGDGIESVALPGRSLFAALPPFDRLLLDDGALLSKEFTRSEAAALADGSIASMVRDTEAMTILGQPKKYPVPLMEELKKSLPRRPEIAAAYIAQLQDSPAATPRIVIAFDTLLEDGELSPLCDRARLLAESLGYSEVYFTRLADDAVGEYLRSESKPFYRRES